MVVDNTAQHLLIVWVYILEEAAFNSKPKVPVTSSDGLTLANYATTHSLPAKLPELESAMCSTN